MNKETRTFIWGLTLFLIGFFLLFTYTNHLDEHTILCNVFSILINGSIMYVGKNLIKKVT